MKTNKLPTVDRVRELLSYNPETGVFTRLVGRQGYSAGDIAGCTKNRGYVQIMIDGVQYQAHRLAWFYVHGSWPADQIDHINGSRADNRLCNLREATNSANQQNRRKARADNKLGFLGVTRHGNVFQAQIMLDGKARYLGTYKTPETAHAAYLSAKKDMHPGGTHG